MDGPDSPSSYAAGSATCSNLMWDCRTNTILSLLRAEGGPPHLRSPSGARLEGHAHVVDLGGYVYVAEIYWVGLYGAHLGVNCGLMMMA